MGLYLDSGFVNFDYIFSHTDSPFIFLVGGRGTGKTYGAIKWLIDNRQEAIFMRRTQEETDAVLNNEKMSTAAQVFIDKGLEMQIDKLSKKNAITSIVDGEDLIPVFVSCSLSGAAGIRGFSNERANFIFYDEFIKERHKANIKGEGFALLNAYETFNRNRELLGRPPMRLVCMSNSDDIFNPIFKAFNILKDAFNMKKKGKRFITCADGLVTIYDLTDSPISEKKAQTVLYRLGNQEFNNMAIENMFETPDEILGSENIKGYKPLCKYGDFCIYSARGHFYVSPHGDSRLVFNADDKGRRALLSTFPLMRYAYLHDLITGENIEAVAAIGELFA